MNQGYKTNLQRAIRAIRSAKKVMVVSHVNPDGDTIGCQLALGLACLQMGKKVLLLSPHGMPTRYQFLPGSELVLSESDETADIAIAVDCGSRGQLGTAAKNYFKAKKTVQIDHHDFGASFGGIQLMDLEASAVGEIVYDLLRAMKIELTPAIAMCLLTSVIIDTGAFRFSNIRAKTFEVCSRLIKTGVDLRYLIEESYWTKSRSTLKLSSHALFSAEYSDDGSVVWSVIYQKDMKKFGAVISDADAVADDLRSVQGVKIAAVLRETEGGKFRASLRSKHGIHVGSLAEEFGGGGHHNSAGCLIKKKDFPRLISRLKKLAEI